MTKKEIQNRLHDLRDEKRSYIAIRNFKEGDDICMEANRNGLLDFCGLVLESIDSNDLEEDGMYDFPESFWHDSDHALTIRIKDGVKRDEESTTEPFIQTIGCYLVAVILAIVFLVGIATSFRWFLTIFD